jgi:hypothetical protein
MGQRHSSQDAFVEWLRSARLDKFMASCREIILEVARLRRSSVRPDAGLKFLPSVSLDSAFLADREKILNVL